MEHNLDHYFSVCDPIIAALRNNLADIPTETARLEIALLYAVQLGAGTRDIRDLSYDAVLRLHWQIAERVAQVLNQPPIPSKGLVRDPARHRLERSPADLLGHHRQGEWTQASSTTTHHAEKTQDRAGNAL